MTLNFSAIRYNSFGKLLRVPLRLIPEHAHIPILQGPMRGMKWIAGSADHGCWLGSYETAKQWAFRASLNPGDTVYDIGANVGLFSLLASAAVGPKGRVISFEPCPRNLGYLRKHLQMNHLSNCQVFEAAVSDSDGSGYFNLGADPSSGYLGEQSGGTLEVNMVRIDGLVTSGQIPPPDVMKCDIEGGEYHALKGASETIDRVSPVIFLATHNDAVHDLCRRLLSDLGYNLSPIDGHAGLDCAGEFIARRPVARKS